MCGGGTSKFALTLERLVLNEIGSNNGTKCSERGETDSNVDCDGSCWVCTKCKKIFNCDEFDVGWTQKEGRKGMFIWKSLHYTLYIT